MSILKYVAVFGLAAQAFASGMAQTHDGFFLNMGIGAGAGDISYKVSESSNWMKFAFEGMPGLLNIRVGGSPVQNLAISADLQGVTIAGPKMKTTTNIEFLEGSADSEKLDEDDNVNITGLGLGVTYYFPEFNMFLGGTLAPTGQATADIKGEKESYDGSFLGYSFRLGKEWWVSDSWGLGVELNYTHFKLVDDSEEYDQTWETSAFGILFSATFN